MNKLLFLLLMILFSSLMKAEFKLKFSHSEAINYLVFLDTGFRQPNISGSLYDYINKQSNNPFTAKRKKIFNSFKSDLQNGFNYHSTITNRPDGFWGESALKALAINASSLESFEQQLSMLLSYEGVNKYFDLKKEIYPFFKNTFWRKTLSVIKEEERKINVELKRTNFTKLLYKAKRFYKSAYPENISFKISFISIPDQGISNKHSSAENLKDIQVVSYLQSKGAISSLDIVFHEFSHALYRAQSVKTKKMIDDFYLKSNHSHSLFVYRYFNEAIATALGNGWFREKQDGAYLEKPWYSVNYIDKLAKVYYPVVKKYLNQGKSIDRNFLKETLRLAKKVFPRVSSDIVPNFMAVNMYVDHNIHYKDFRKVLKSNIRIQSFGSYSKIEKKHLDSFDIKSLKTSIFISKNDPGLSKLFAVSEKAQRGSFLVIYPKSEQYRFWFNVDSMDDFKSLMKQLLSLDKLPEVKSIIKL